MKPAQELRLVDEHQIAVAASRAQVWGGLRRYVDSFRADAEHSVVTRLLGTEPRAGFEIASEVPNSRLDLTGRHRFSRYRLGFELADAAGDETLATHRILRCVPSSSVSAGTGREAGHAPGMTRRAADAHRSRELPRTPHPARLPRRIHDDNTPAPGASMRRPVPLPTGRGQESVWDYPRPPRLEPSTSVIEVVLDGTTVARTERAFRVLETSHPPTYYLPVSAFVPGSLRPAGGQSLCEWKGTAAYFDVVAGSRVAHRAAWSYPHPAASFAALVDHVALYPSAMDRCTVDGEVVTAQPGDFYGGWITSRVVGPFKGEPGSRFW